MKKYLLISGACLLVVYSINQLYLHQTLKYKIVNYCRSQPECTLRLKEITNFEWDTLYVFANFIENRFVDSFFGYNLNHKYDNSSKYIYTDKQRVVHYEEIESRVSEPPKKGDYLINIPVGSALLLFNKENAVFNVCNKEMETYPVLYPLRISDNPFLFDNSDGTNKPNFAPYDSLSALNVAQDST